MPNRLNQTINKVVSDDSVDSIDNDGNFVTTRTVVTQTITTPAQKQAQADQLAAQITSLQAKQTAITTQLSRASQIK